MFVFLAPFWAFSVRTYNYTTILPLVSTGCHICDINCTVPIGIDPGSGLAVDSSAFRRRAARVTLSDDPDTATLETGAEMCRQINQAALCPFIRAITVNAVDTYRGGPGWAGSNVNPFANSFCIADSCWWWCKWNLRFRHHSNMFEAWSADLGDPQTKLQLLIAPDILIRMRRMEGDCAIYTMMLCAMLKSVGLGYQIMPLAVDRFQPDIFSHVCARLVAPDGSSETLDASHGDYPGWQVPAEDIHRMWIIDENGRRVQGSFAGLHDYRRSRFAGMGDVCDPASADYDAAACEGSGVPSGLPSFGPLCPANMTQVGNACVDTSSSWPSGSMTAPAQNSAQWAVFAASLAKAGLTLAEINSIQPGTVVGPNGQILRQNPGYSVPAPGAIGPVGGNTIVYMGVGLFAILILGSVFKGGR